MSGQRPNDPCPKCSTPLLFRRVGHMKKPVAYCAMCCVSYELKQ